MPNKVAVEGICAKVDECHKIAMVMDKDIPDELKAERIRAVCRKCLGKEVDLEQHN